MLILVYACNNLLMLFILDCGGIANDFILSFPVKKNCKYLCSPK